MNERGIRELKGILSKIHDRSEDEEEKQAIEEAIDDLDRQLIDNRGSK